MQLMACRQALQNVFDGQLSTLQDLIDRQLQIVQSRFPKEKIVWLLARL